MDTLVEQKVKDYLRNQWYYDPYDCGAIMYNIRRLAQVSGNGLDRRFANAGLAAGPEGKLAACVVNCALGGGASSTTAYELKIALDRWIRTTGPMGS